MMKKSLGFLVTAFALSNCSGQNGTSVLTLTNSSNVPGVSVRTHSSSVSAPVTLTAKDLESIVWIGDSFAVGGNITTPLASGLKAIYGDGGVGWIDLYYLDSINPGVTMGATQGWVQQRNTPTATGLNLSDISTTDVSISAHISISVKATSATLYYYTQPGGGSFEWSVDTAPPIAVDTNTSSPGIASSTIANLSDTTHLFWVRITSAGTAGITLDGLDARSGSGVVLHKLGSAGSGTRDWAAVNAGLWEKQLAGLHPTLVVIMLSPNDQAELTSVTQQSANLTTLLRRIRTVSAAPIVLVPSPDNGLGRSPAMSAYNTEQKGLAATYVLGYIDLLDQIAPFNPAWFNADLLHPNVEGGTAISDIVLEGLNLQTPPPTVTVTPEYSSIVQSHALSIKVAVDGAAGSPAPTGSVMLRCGDYLSTPVTLSQGTATITIPSGSLAIGTEHIFAIYTPDANSATRYLSAIGSASETVIAQTAAPTVTVTTATYSAAD